MNNLREEEEVCECVCDRLTPGVCRLNADMQRRTGAARRVRGGRQRAEGVRQAELGRHALKQGQGEPAVPDL